MTTLRKPMHERRAEIADAILRIVGSRGIASLTMATLAAEVGVTPGALFRHFASRDEMLGEAARHAEALLAGAFPPAGLAPLERLERLVLARMAAVEEHPGLLGLMLSDQFMLALPGPAAEALRSLVARTRAFIVEALREGVAGSVVRADIAADDLAMIVLGAIQIAAAGGAGALGPGPRGEARRRRLWTTLAVLLSPSRGGGAEAARPASSSRPRRRTADGAPPRRARR